MAEVKMRLNLNALEVELVVDGQVALTSGQDVFLSWVEAANKLNPPAAPEPVKVEAPVVDSPVKVEEPVPAPVVETPAVEVNPESATVDTEKKD